MTRAVACVVLGMLWGCSVAEPEPEPEPLPAVLAQADSIIVAMDPEIRFMTAAGAAGDSDPECQGALRDYAFAVAAYGWALNTVRMAPSTANIAWAAVMALAVVSAQANVYTHCSTDRTRPA